jgi:hypothetical protein|tara:strand:- start:136 stop:321 length:186 start_codon:yes stop_codon:yes gene_type:complete
MYNVHQYIKKIEDLEDFKYPFERLKKVEGINDEPEEEAKPEEENKIEEKPEAEEEDEEPQI